MSSPEPRVRVIRELSDLESIVPQWWDLLDRASSPQPTRTPLWLMSWWQVFGGTGGRELRVVVVEDDEGRLLGIAPLVRRWVRRAGVVPIAVLELMGSGEAQEDEIFSEYIGVTAARGSEEAVCDLLIRALGADALDEWDEVDLRSMNDDDPIVPMIARGLADGGCEVQSKPTLECPYVTLPSTWDAYLASLDGQKRYFVRRSLRDLDAWAAPSGGALFRTAADDADYARAWTILQSLHEERWRGGGVFQSPRFRSFHEKVIEGLRRGEGGTVELSWLEVDNSPIAVIYNIVYRGHVHFYQGGRKLDLPKQVRPGIAIHVHAMQRAIEQGHHTYDFLGKADQYKKQLAPSNARKLVTITAVAATMRARASHGLVRTAHRLVNFARRISATTPVPGSDKPDGEAS